MNTNESASPRAMVNAVWVAEVYENGWGVPQDYRKARKWFEEAASAGNTEAMINLGRLYEQGLARLLHHKVVVDKVGSDFGAGEERSQKAG